MESIGNIFESILPFKRAERKPGDYEQDGILYCGVCRAPKEMIIHFDEEKKDEGRIVPVCCQCAEAAQDKEEERQRALRKRIAADEALQTLAEIEAVAFPASTFAGSVGADPKTERTMRRYAERFDEIAKQNIGLMLCGEPGCGKTFFAQAIANALIERGLLVMFTSIRQLAGVKKDDAAYVRRCIKSCDLLVLDDLGAERETSYMAEQAYEIVNIRYEAKRPLLVTTNLTPKLMAQETDLNYSRTFQRVLEMCKPILITGNNRRPGLAAQKFAAWATLMGDEE